MTAIPTRLVIASSNAGKLAEFDELLAGGGIEVVAQSALGVADADETGFGGDLQGDKVA